MTLHVRPHQTRLNNRTVVVFTYKYRVVPPIGNRVSRPFTFNNTTAYPN